MAHDRIRLSLKSIQFKQANNGLIRPNAIL